MSGYLDGLRAQSGVVVGADAVPGLAARVLDARGVVAHEIEEVREAQPAPPAPAARVAPDPAAEPSPPPLPGTVHVVGEARHVVPPDADGFAAERAATMEVHAEEPARASSEAGVDVERRAIEPPVADGEVHAEAPAAATPHESIAPEPVATAVREVVRRDETPSERSLRQLLEVRRWVAATPAPGESHVAADAPDVERHDVELVPTAHTVATQPAERFDVVRERVAEHSEENVTVSIGTVVVTVEDSAAQAPASPPAPAPHDRAPSPPDAFRFDRLYLRR